MRIIIRILFFCLRGRLFRCRKGHSSKALGAVAAGAGALEAAAVAVCAGALEAAAAVTAAVARVTRSCLGLLRPSGVLMVLNLRFSR